MGKRISADKAEEQGPDVRALRAEAAELYRRGRIKSACAAQEGLVRQLGVAASRDDYALLSLYHFSAGMEKAAADIIEEALERWPDDPEFLANIGISYLRANIFDKAEGWLTRAAAVLPDAANLHDGLARLYMEKGDRDRSISHGERALELKDQEAEAMGAGRINLSEVSVPEFDAAHPERNIIAFSLWGTVERYLIAAVTNARLAPHIYPGWTARFYCEEGVPEHVLADLLEAGADVVMRPPQSALYQGLFWRFEPAFEEGVDRYLVRDADSVVSVRERLAVEEWLASGRHFHVMRDYLTHTDPILAGLWGGTGGSLPRQLQRGINAYLDDAGKTANCDQKFLREKIWPIARQSCLVHDSNFQVLGAKPFPGGDAYSRDGLQRGHVGSSEHVRRTLSVPSRRGEITGGPLRPRERFVFVLAPCRNVLDRFLAEQDSEPEQQEIRILETNLAASTFQRGGNSSEVNGFWRRQASLLRTGSAPELLVSSDVLLFSGLMENIGLFCEDVAVDVVLLQQPIGAAAKAIGRSESLLELDSTHRIINPAPFIAFGEAGHIFWHAAESLTRMAFYQARLAGLPNLSFIEANASKPEPAPMADSLAAELGRIADQFNRTPADLARRFAANGGWLG